MDWTNIIIAVISALGGGGLAVLFTRKETKEGMSLDNMQKVLDAKDRIIEEREERCKELKNDLDKKDAKIDELHKMNATLRHRLDDANTKAAVAEVMRCDITKCTNRRPPFGSNHRVAEDFIETKTEN
jgi:peptidoglycan hydrolase CwlO-like protein